MSEEKKNINDETSSVECSKGECLRLAREAKGLEVAEAAKKLYFEERFILALENDDYSIFAGSAYLYGYMRAYVKLLELPLDDFVSDLKNIEDENETLFENISYGPVSEPESRKWILPTMIGLLMVIIIVAVVLMNGDGLAKAGSIASPGEVEEQAAQELRRISIPLAEKVQTDSVIEVANNKSSAAKMAHGALVNQDVSADVAGSRLLLEYKTDSWTDIRDVDGKRLVYRMVEKGNRLELDSSPTYSILLGYSPGVDVSWNDQPFNLAEYERENIAYFVVGKENKTSSVTSQRE